MKSLIGSLEEFDRVFREMLEEDDVEFAIQIVVRKSDQFVLQISLPCAETATPKRMASVLRHVAARFESGKAAKVRL